MSDHTLWQRAAGFCARAHAHQIRKDGCTPYASHPFRVAMTALHVFGCDDHAVIAAALLHDVIEDCGVDYDEVAEHFGEEVATLVALVSKDPRLVEDERERRYDEQLARGPWKARLVKLADVFDNLSDAIAESRAVMKTRDKAIRAVALARDDAELARARAIVQALIDSVG